MDEAGNSAVLSFSIIVTDVYLHTMEYKGLTGYRRAQVFHRCMDGASCPIQIGTANSIQAIKKTMSEEEEKFMLKIFMEPNGLDIIKENMGILLIGNIVAFIVAMAAIKFFIGFVTKYGFKAFGWYRIILGGIILVMLMTGHNLTIG